MNLKIVTGVIALFMFADVPDWLLHRTQQKPPTRKRGRSRAVFRKARMPMSTILLRQKAGTWEIKSDSVKLGEHVGHTVTITGVVSNAKAHGMKEDTKEEMKEHGMDKHATEHGHMTVTDLTMVSDTCQK